MNNYNYIRLRKTLIDNVKCSDFNQFIIQLSNKLFIHLDELKISNKDELINSDKRFKSNFNLELLCSNLIDMGYFSSKAEIIKNFMFIYMMKKKELL